MIDVSLILYVLVAAGLIGLLIYGLIRVLPKIELRGHTEMHNGIRVREIAFTWLRGKRRAAGSQVPQGLECVVYVTLKS